MIETFRLEKKYSLRRGGTFTAVDRVSFVLPKGKILGLVGRSGSGKSTLARMIVGITPPSSGYVFFNKKLKTGLLPRQIQMVFQNPFSSLNPMQRIEKILKEPTDIHRLPSRAEELLEMVCMPKEIGGRFPDELSGGQKQRIAIARALALNPSVLICDEPVSALDVSIQAQILNLLKQLQKQLGLTILFISHDFSVVEYLCDEIALMEGGKFLEPQLLEQKPPPNRPIEQALVTETETVQL